MSVLTPTSSTGLLAALERLGGRIVTMRRTRAVGAITGTLLLLVYGFAHVIGGDLLEQRVASQIVRDGLGHRLYDFELQTRYEQAAVSPQALPGLIPFM